MTVINNRLEIDKKPRKLELFELLVAFPKFIPVQEYAFVLVSESESEIKKLIQSLIEQNIKIGCIFWREILLQMNKDSKCRRKSKPDSPYKKR